MPTMHKTTHLQPKLPSLHGSMAQDVAGLVQAPLAAGLPGQTRAGGDAGSDRGCKKCGGEMKQGLAIEQTFTGMPDFPGCRDVVTLSAGGPGRLIGCMKCVDCGWSTT